MKIFKYVVIVTGLLIGGCSTNSVDPVSIEIENKVENITENIPENYKDLSTLIISTCDYMKEEDKNYKNNQCLMILRYSSQIENLETDDLYFAIGIINGHIKSDTNYKDHLKAALLSDDIYIRKTALRYLYE